MRVCWCVVPSPTRDRVCSLQLLPDLPRAVFLGSESRSTQDHIPAVSDFRFPQPEGAKFLYLCMILHLNMTSNLKLKLSYDRLSKSSRTHGHILLSHLRLPQPGGPGPCIYIPQEQGDPVIPPGTGFRFCRLLPSRSRSHIMTDSVLVSGAHLGPATNFTFSLKFYSDSCGFVIL
jgi:hypothetical protein